MIPVRLTIKNFLSYGNQPQTINFEPYQLICLSGKNGHGKSALLDAITWTLWGHARKTGGVAKADEGLVRLGQTSMTVSLDFMSNGQTYRARREFSYTTGKAFTHLDFGIIDPATHFFKPLTDKTIRDTQAKIDTAIGLNYESFINSVFLRQGQSNEFSKKSAKERKDILLTILGLTHFEKVRKKALEKIKLVGLDKEHYSKIHEKLSAEIATIPLVQEQQTKVQEALAKVLQEERTTTAVLDTLDAKIKILLESRTAIELLQQQQTQMSEKISSLSTLFNDTVARWRMIHAQQLRAQALSPEKEQILEQEYRRIEQEYVELLAIKEQVFILKTQENQLVQQKQYEYTQKKQQIQQACHVHEVTIHGIQTTISQENKELQILQEKLTQNAQDQAKNACNDTELHLINEKIALHEKNFERKKSFYHMFIAQGNALKSELKDTVLKQSLTHDSTPNPSCPLCEQNLSSSRKKFLQTKFIDREHFIQHQVTRLSRVITTLKEQLIADHTYAETLKKQQDQYTIRAAQHATLVQEEIQIRAARATKEQTLVMQTSLLEKEQTTLKEQEQTLLTLEQEYQKILAHDNALCVLRAQIHEAEIRLQTFDRVQEQKKEYAQKRDSMRAQREAQRQLHTEQVLQQQRRITICTTSNEIKALRVAHRQLDEHCAPHRAHILEMQELEKQRETLKKALQDLLKKKEELLIQQGSLDQQFQALAKKKQEFTEQQQIITDSDSALFEYQAVEHALSKDGIQALLIENALPEIEHEANYLLSKLTDNQAHLSIESLRDLKGGGAKETLDIKISDAMGIRPYELFSGGEAFRIDFALRIALSKLLARRAGASLQTLIIDEGFGSQDEEGLGHIMDAIYKIQEDFAKIIIVSHLPTMKDQFPVHFVVQKGPQGSAITVIEQD